MLLNVEISEKSIGVKKLFENLSLIINDGEKIGIIGRNGAGKTTLFRMIMGDDSDFDGEINLRRGASVVMTAQEHSGSSKISCLDYILDNLPDYSRLHHIIEDYPEHMGDNLSKIHAYSQALERFEQLDYFSVTERVTASLSSYQIPPDRLDQPLSEFSGGQKRLIELVKVQESRANLALIDEPTNHMDYVAKAEFIKWMRAASSALAVITHDRDVLAHVDRIIEIKDKTAFSYRGNYSAYLRTNSSRTVAGMAQYEVSQRTIENLKKQIAYARSKKAAWGGTADKKNPFVVMEERALRQMAELEKVSKPSFWIDKESADELSHKMVEKYQKYKDKNIKLSGMDDEHRRQELLAVDKLSLGYDQPLFKDISFMLYPGEKVRLHGRNGAGKTTLVRQILATYEQTQPESKLFAGEIRLNNKTRIGTYEQEIDEQYLPMKLGEAVEEAYFQKGVKITKQDVMRLLGNYLFNPQSDFSQIIETLSGGQKARFQIIMMLAASPNLLILDEPTNHLDLPSIEELEDALQNYQGAIIYISHDSYFDKKLGGQEVTIAP